MSTETPANVNVTVDDNPTPPADPAATPLTTLARAVDSWNSYAVSDEERTRALVLLNRLLCKLDCPASKLLEYAGLQLGSLRLTIIQTTNGPDAVDQHDNYWELKTSVVKVKKGLKTNWNWDLDKADWETNLEAKMSTGGGAILRALNSDGELLRYYTLSRRFVVEYFRSLQNASGKRPTAHNMGCQRCSKCHHWHRALRLQRISQDFDRGFAVDFAKLQASTVSTHKCDSANTTPFVSYVNRS